MQGKNSSEFFYIEMNALSSSEMTNNMLTVAEQLPPSARAIYTLLSEQGPLTSKDLIQKCDLAPRTVRYALKRLTKEGLVKKAPYLLDMRSSKYFVETG